MVSKTSAKRPAKTARKAPKGFVRIRAPSDEQWASFCKQFELTEKDARLLGEDLVMLIDLLQVSKSASTHDRTSKQEAKELRLHVVHILRAAKFLQRYDPFRTDVDYAGILELPGLVYCEQISSHVLEPVLTTSWLDKIAPVRNIDIQTPSNAEKIAARPGWILSSMLLEIATVVGLMEQKLKETSAPGRKADKVVEIAYLGIQRSFRQLGIMPSKNEAARYMDMMRRVFEIIGLTHSQANSQNTKYFRGLNKEKELDQK